jgi:predicted small lipoprotein YifL
MKEIKTKNLTHAFWAGLCLLSMIILSGCGQTGPLFLPIPETPDKAEIYG